MQIDLISHFEPLHGVKTLIKKITNFIVVVFFCLVKQKFFPQKYKKRGLYETPPRWQSLGTYLLLILLALASFTCTWVPGRGFTIYYFLKYYLWIIFSQFSYMPNFHICHLSEIWGPKYPRGPFGFFGLQFWVKIINFSINRWRLLTVGWSTWWIGLCRLIFCIAYLSSS